VVAVFEAVSVTNVIKQQRELIMQYESQSMLM